MFHFFVLHEPIWVVKFDCSIHFLLTYSHKSSDWDASTSPRQLVQVAIVVPKRLKNLRTQETKRRMVPRDDTRGTSYSGQVDTTETWGRNETES